MRIIPRFTFAGIFMPLIFAAFLFPAKYAQGQESTEFGISFGASNFLSDLGGTKEVGRTFIIDLEVAATRPSIGVFYRHNFNNQFAWRTNLNYMILVGNDEFIRTELGEGGGWPRMYRDLHVRTHVGEFTTGIEFNLLPYIPGSSMFRFTPYASLGVGIFYFEPMAKYGNDWVKLQPLGTEGQGLPQYPGKKKYSRIAINAPVGVGVKWNVNSSYSFGFEIVHRFTTTDYMDDVSTYYANPAYFYDYYGDEKGSMVAALANRSSGEIPAMTAPGEQRGNPTNNDQYMTATITINYLIGSSRKHWGRIACPTTIGF